MIKLTIRVDRCKGCGLCVHACPKKILRISPDVINIKGHHPAELTDPAACVGCASCATMCPDCVITIEKEDKNNG
ncbi:MAG: 4Fe-4S binding protein [Clostridia bacterium]|nr:4Fe-4S binding protein [Clostridia bacterium]